MSAAIRAQMEKDGTDHVWEDMRPIGEAAIREHFPNILERCEEEGYDPIHERSPLYRPSIILWAASRRT